MAQKAQEKGYHPEIILAGRRLNDSMGDYVANQVIKMMIKKGIKVNGSKILMLGIAFKENCPDVRNTKVVDVVKALQDFETEITIYDPWANPEEVKHEYGLETICELPNQQYDAVVLAVSHNEFKALDFNKLKKDIGIVFDVKGVLNEKADARL